MTSLVRTTQTKSSAFDAVVHATHQAAGGANPLVEPWRELLWYLACLDSVWIEAGGTGRALRQRLSAREMRVEGDLGWVIGPGFQIHCFLDEWHAMHPRLVPSAAIPDGFRITDQAGTSLLSLGVDSPADRFALRILARAHALDRQWRCDTRTGEDRATRVSRHLQQLSAWLEAGARPLEVGDIAEVCGWLTLTPERLHRRGRAMRAEPEHIPLFLQTVAEQALAVRVLTGTGGLAQCCEGVFDRTAYDGNGWLELVADGACFRLDPATVHSAWVLSRCDADRAWHQLRLYDAEGGAILLMESLPVPGCGEHPIWRALIGAVSAPTA